MGNDTKVKLLRIAQVSARYGISEYMIRRSLETGHFPEPTIVGANTRLWPPAVLDAFFQQMPLADLRAKVASARLRQRGRKTHAASGGHNTQGKDHGTDDIE